MRACRRDRDAKEQRTTDGVGPPQRTGSSTRGGRPSQISVRRVAVVPAASRRAGDRATGTRQAPAGVRVALPLGVGRRRPSGSTPRLPPSPGSYRGWRPTSEAWRRVPSLIGYRRRPPSPGPPGRCEQAALRAAIHSRTATAFDRGADCRTLCAPQATARLLGCSQHIHTRSASCNQARIICSLAEAPAEGLPARIPQDQSRDDEAPPFHPGRAGGFGG